MSERRRFVRIEFHAKTELSQGPFIWPVKLLDLSLKGLLIEKPQPWLGDPEEPFMADIHLSPEALAGGPLAKVRDGDLIRLDAAAGTLEALVPSDEWAARENATRSEAMGSDHAHGLGRELFAGMRRNVTSAEEGACTWL